MKPKFLRSLILGAVILSPAFALATFADDWAREGVTALALATAAGVTAYVLLLNLFVLGGPAGKIGRLLGPHGLLRLQVGVAAAGTLFAGFHGAVKAAIFPGLLLHVHSGQAALVGLAGVAVVAAGAAAALPQRGGRRVRRGAVDMAVTDGRHAGAWLIARRLAGATLLVLLFHVFTALAVSGELLRTLVLGGWFAAAAGTSLVRVIRAPRRAETALPIETTR